LSTISCETSSGNPIVPGIWLATSLMSGGKLYTLAALPPHIAQIQRRSSGPGPRWRPKKYTTGRHCACRTTTVRVYLGVTHRRLASVSPDDRARM
jgi:hypothetical protein